MTTAHARPLGVLLLTSSVLASACAVDTGDDHALVAIDESTIVHIQPVRAGRLVVYSAPPGSHLSYFGGPVLPNVHVSPIYWNSNVQFIPTLNSFYNDVPNSSLYTMLTQYGVERGDGQPGAVADRVTQNISDANIRTAVLVEINRGTVPLPSNPDNYYPVHLAPGMQVSSPDGGLSCQTFCAYHGTFRVLDVNGNTFNVNYGVLPDLGGACNGICGANTVVNNTTSVASHEMVEATTDPAVGLATTIDFPLAWYDPAHGEIGDICNGQQGTTTGNGHSYVIQLEFSNAANNCVQN